MARGNKRKQRPKGRSVTTTTEPISGVVERAMSGEQRQVTVTAERFSGPIPHPSVLEAYERLVPGAAQRIIAMAETQQSHRIEQESAVNGANIRSQKATDDRLDRGQWMAFILALVGLICSGVFIWLGHEVIGSIFAGTTLVALVGAFLIDRSKSQ